MGNLLAVRTLGARQTLVLMRMEAACLHRKSHNSALGVSTMWLRPTMVPRKRFSLHICAATLVGQTVTALETHAHTSSVRCCRISRCSHVSMLSFLFAFLSPACVLFCPIMCFRIVLLCFLFYVSSMYVPAHPLSQCCSLLFSGMRICKADVLCACLSASLCACPCNSLFLCLSHNYINNDNDMIKTCARQR